VVLYSLAVSLPLEPHISHRLL